MPSLQQILDRMTELATGVAGDSDQSPLVDSEVTAYVVWPHAIRSAVFAAVRKGDDLQDLIQEHEIEITDGSGDFPATILREGLDRITFEDRAFVQMLSWADYQQCRFTTPMYDYWALLGDTIYFKEGDAPITSDYSGDITIFAPTLDALPEDPDEAMPISARLIEAAIMIGASVLRGEMPLSNLTEQYLKTFNQPKSFDMDFCMD